MTIRRLAQLATFHPTRSSWKTCQTLVDEEDKERKQSKAWFRKVSIVPMVILSADVANFVIFWCLFFFWWGNMIRRYLHQYPALRRLLFLNVKHGADKQTNRDWAFTHAQNRVDNENTCEILASRVHAKGDSLYWNFKARHAVEYWHCWITVMDTSHWKQILGNPESQVTEIEDCAKLSGHLGLRTRYTWTSKYAWATGRNRCILLISGRPVRWLTKVGWCHGSNFNK